jgi:hypothetical protein
MGPMVLHSVGLNQSINQSVSLKSGDLMRRSTVQGNDLKRGPIEGLLLYIYTYHLSTGRSKLEIYISSQLCSRVLVLNHCDKSSY